METLLFIEMVAENTGWSREGMLAKLCEYIDSNERVAEDFRQWLIVQADKSQVMPLPLDQDDAEGNGPIDLPDELKTEFFIFNSVSDLVNGAIIPEDWEE